MHIGVVGLGSIGRRHVGNLLALGCDVWGFDQNTDATERAHVEYPALAVAPHVWNAPDAFDAVVIATPWNTHLEWVEWAIGRNLPFFVEKPLGTLDQLPRWRELAAMDLPVNQVGYMLRFHDVVAEMRRRVPSASRGGFHVECDMRSWPGSAYGPALLELSHEIDLALSFGAEPIVRVVEVDGQCVEFDLGVSWGMRLISDSNRYLRSWDISGRGAGYMWHCESPEEIGVEMYVAEMVHFLECVREQKPTACPLADGLRVLEVCQQVETLCQSSASSKPA